MNDGYPWTALANAGGGGGVGVEVGGGVGGGEGESAAGIDAALLRLRQSLHHLPNPMDSSGIDLNQSFRRRLLSMQAATW